MLREHIINDDNHTFVVEQDGADVVALFAALKEYHAELAYGNGRPRRSYGHSARW
jgi:hypothetical protein